MITLNNISIQYSGEYLFKDVSLHISPNDRIGLVGANGAGKTTLLKIIVGLIQPDSGSVQKANYVSIGYLPQDFVSMSDRSLIDEAKSAFEDINILQSQLEQVYDKIQKIENIDSEEYQELIEIQGELQFKLENLDAYKMQSQVEKVLMGLGFQTYDFERKTYEFSGGWQMRIALAKLLLSNPTLLLLDEPTNHLDLDSLRWLEEFLISYKGAVIIISHDRAFLDNMTRKTLVLLNKKMEVYAGNYSFYERESQIRRQNLLNAAKNQQQQLKQAQRFIERFRYKATKARQVQSRIKQLEKIDIIQIEEDTGEITFRFPQVKQSGVIVAELINVCKKYPGQKTNKQLQEEKLILENINLTIERGDRIALVGMNGSGKSTLTRILSGKEQPTSGEVKYGYNVSIAYFAQEQIDELQNNLEVIQIAELESSGQPQAELRTLLGCFLFEGDDVFKKVSVLSGGEKSRLALVKMLLKPANFLILDEPTNHLDMKSKKVLQEALINFEGTYIIVSHDRNFLDPIVNKVIEVKDRKIKTYLGNISEFIEAKDKETLSKEEISKSKSEFENIKLRKRLEAEERQRIYRITRPIKDKLDQVEKLIMEKESLKFEYEKIMANPNFYSNSKEVISVNNAYKNVIRELENLYKEWTELSDKLETLMREHQTKNFAS